MSTYTQRINFSINDGPQFGGVNTVQGSPNDTPRIYNGELCLNGATTPVDDSGFMHANFLAMGFNMQLAPVQTGSPTPTQLAAASVVIHLVDGLSGGATDYTITLGVGQVASWVVIPATLVHDVSSITVVGDTNADVQIYGLLLLTA